MIKKILFPADFSPACAAMAGYVRRAATIFGAGVALLHVANLGSQDPLAISRLPGPLLTRAWDRGLIDVPGQNDVVHALSLAALSSLLLSRDDLLPSAT